MEQQALPRRQRLSEGVREWVAAGTGAVPQVGADAYPKASLAFAVAMIALTGWGVAASYIDGWAHNRDKADSFFTPWHTNLYGSLTVLAAFVAFTIYRNHQKGYTWLRSLPQGYERTVVGVVLFGVGGFGDMIWHGLFGIEPGNEALVAPMHLILAAGGGLIVIGLISWAWQRAESDLPAPPWMQMLLLAVPIGYLLSMITFMTQFYHPFGRTGAAEDYYMRPDLTVEVTSNTLELAGVMLQSIILVGLVLLFVKNGRLRPGSMTVILAINTGLMVFMKSNRLATGAWPLFVAGVLAGLLADLVLWRLLPSAARPVALRLFTFAVPVFVYALYFLTILLFGGGIVYSVHVWTGAIVVAGIAGWLTSYLIVPTPMMRFADTPLGREP